MFQISTSFQAQFTPRFNCHKCKGDKRHESLKKVQNCEGPGENVVVRDHDLGYEYFRCPGAYYNPIINDYLRMHKVFIAGTNPFGGSIMDTPNKFVEISALLDNLILEQRDKNA